MWLAALGWIGNGLMNLVVKIAGLALKIFAWAFLTNWKRTIACIILLFILIGSKNPEFMRMNQPAIMSIGLLVGVLLFALSFLGIFKIK